MQFLIARHDIRRLENDDRWVKRCFRNQHAGIDGETKYYWL